MKTFWQHNEETECVWHTWSRALKSVICRNTMSISTRASFVYSSPDVCWLEYKSDKNFSSEFGGLGLCSNILTGSSANRNATSAMVSGILSTNYIWKQECIPVGCVPSATVAVWGGSAPGGWYPSMHWSRPPPCGQTDTCKNITFATSLRTVITLFYGLARKYTSSVD